MTQGSTIHSAFGRKSSGSALLLASAVGLLALPSAVLALNSRYEAKPLAVVAANSHGAFIPAEVDPRLARSITVRALAKGKTFRFTPAATPNRMDRSVTVAVRLYDPGVGALTKHTVGNDDDSALALRIAPTAYSLGAARGYKSFARSNGLTARNPDLADLAKLPPGTSIQPSDSRLSPRIALDNGARAGRTPRTFSGQAEPSVDLGGSYRLTRNLNVTAGVRYSSERDRLVPLTDGRQDSQAVYVGTQFRF